ncbi:MAG: hypothetical protein ACJ8LL_07135 [Candidatus Udaeobacter sp.]
MKHWSFRCASTLAIAAGGLFLTSCSTPQTRISEHPDLYHGLSQRDQALVNKQQIRIGMSRPAVWLAWGSPSRRIIGNIGGDTTETWVYTYYASYPYYPYEPLDEYFGAPLYDPFCYSWFPPSIPYPGRLVTFAHGKAVSFQYVTSH